MIDQAVGCCFHGIETIGTVGAVSLGVMVPAVTTMGGERFRFPPAPVFPLPASLVQLGCRVYARP